MVLVPNLKDKNQLFASILCIYLCMFLCLKPFFFSSKKGGGFFWFVCLFYSFESAFTPVHFLAKLTLFGQVQKLILPLTATKPAESLKNMGVCSLRIGLRLCTVDWFCTWTKTVNPGTVHFQLKHNQIIHKSKNRKWTKAMQTNNRGTLGRKTLENVLWTQGSQMKAWKALALFPSAS